VRLLWYFLCVFCGLLLFLQRITPDHPVCSRCGSAVRHCATKKKRSHCIAHLTVQVFYNAMTAHCSSVTTYAPEQVSSPAISRVRPLIEIGIVYALLEGALWSLRPAQFWWGLACLAAVIALTAFGGRSPRQLGIGPWNLGGALRVLGYGLLAAAVLLIFARAIGTLHPLNNSNVPAMRGTAYFVWALVQEFLAQSFFYVRFEQVMSPKRAILATAATFAIAHIPNPILLPATFAVGVAFSWAFQRYRNIYPIAMTHAILGLSLAATIPYSWHHHMKVGIAYFVR
jgi:membrane protease YdiL (CAAX protease family)